MPRTQTDRPPKKNGAKAPTKAPREKKLTDFVQRLPVALTDAELLAFGQRLAKCQADLTEHNMHAEQVKKELKAKESAIESERAHLSGIIREKKESRDVQCERWAFYDEGEIVEHRADTGEVIFRRRMESHERQVKLPGIEPAPTVPGLPYVPPKEDAQDIASAAGRAGPSYTEQNPDEPFEVA